MQALITQATEEINRLFGLFNQRFYNGELPLPVVNIQPNSARRNAKGWFTPGRCWQDKVSGELFYCITICPEFFGQAAETICATILHEMVHLHCHINRIRDTSRQQAYHNAEFQLMAETHGLIARRSEKNGWSDTALNREAADFVRENVRQEAINLIYGQFDQQPEDDDSEAGEELKPKKRKKKLKYICPQCKETVEGRKNIRVICGDCRLEFVDADAEGTETPELFKEESSL